MYAIRLARKIVCRNNKIIRKYSTLNKIKSPSNNTNYTNSLSLNLNRKFHSSNKPRWAIPDELSTSELRRECERRQLPSQGSRNSLIERLNEQVEKSGGYDNGLTSDRDLVNTKRQIESVSNRIPERHHANVVLYVEERYQKKIMDKFQDPRIIFHAGNNPCHISIEGKYADVCHLRSQLSNAASEVASRETIYSLPHNLVIKLKRSVLADIRRSFDVNFSMMRCKLNGEDLMLVAVEGDVDKRMGACDALEDVIGRIKSHSLEIPTLETYTLNKKSMSTKFEESLTPSSLRESINDCYNMFQGIVLYLDTRMKEMMHDYQNRLDAIGVETNTNIYLGSRDLFWLNDYQLGIEGQTKDVYKARQQIDQLINHLKSLTMTLVLPSSINLDISKESKKLATSIQKELGVDSVIIQQNDNIYVHLIGTNVQVNAAACIIDSRSHRLNKLRGSESERLARRERIRNLNFVELGIGGLDNTLRDMLRRTFESRLISNRLRKELDLSHIKGVLLYGPPGTGKTLIARKISQILGCNKPKIINGPEVESKWVGEAEKNIRNLFEEAQQEYQEKGDLSNLHVIIFDEIDAIAKKRGGAHAKSRDGALNQLLCCLDGIQTLDNIIVFGLTNRKDCLDSALLRPGRLEVQLEIGLPNSQGRLDILNIHTKKMKEYGRLHTNVNLKILADYADNFSGADLSGMIRSAVSYALEHIDDEDDIIITQEMLQKGLEEIRYAKVRLPSDEDPESSVQGLLQA